MEIRQVQHDGWLHFLMEGKLDSRGASELGTLLTDTVRAGERKIHLDLAQVGYLGSAGIRVLARVIKDVGAAGGELWIHPISEPVQSILALAGMLPLLPTPGNPPNLELSSRPGAEIHLDPGSNFAHFEIHGESSPLTWKTVGSAAGIFGGESKQELIKSTPSRLAIGLGSLPHHGSPAGEFLLINETLLFLPATPFAKPDFLVAEHELVPEIEVWSGLLSEGELSTFFRFETRRGQPVSLHGIAQQILDYKNIPAAALVFVAEVSGIVGASLQVPPRPGSPMAFSVEKLRESMSYASEKIHPHAVALVGGFVCRKSDALSSEIGLQLRPLTDNGEWLGHFHAVIFPPRFLPKRELKIKDTVQLLLETGLPEELLHLLNDSRPEGAGESEFNSGAGWCGPITNL